MSAWITAALGTALVTPIVLLALAALNAMMSGSDTLSTHPQEGHDASESEDQQDA